MTEENLFVPVETEKKQINFATVSEIFDDGITLIFDGEEAPSEKHYQCNSFVVFAPGDRVRVVEDSGTYIVEYPVGNPRKSFEVDHAKEADTATKAESFTYRHTGSRLGFFNRTGGSIKLVNQLSISSSNTTIINKINELLQALRSYGLIK